MLRYEIKKVFSKSKNRIAVIVLFVILVITSILTINKVEFVDENGNSSVGISASRDLREAKNQWAGYLTTDTLSKALEENKTINSSKEALSDDITEQNKAYAKKHNCNAVAQEVDAGVALPDGVHNACGLHSACGHVVADGTQHKAGQAAGNGACKLAEEVLLCTY